MWTCPVVISVSTATRLDGSSLIMASRMASLIWSAILSGCPSVTDSDVNRRLATVLPDLSARPPQTGHRMEDVRAILPAPRGVAARPPTVTGSRSPGRQPLHHQIPDPVGQHVLAGRRD